MNALNLRFWRFWKIYAGINFTFGTDRNFIIADGLKAMICGAVIDGQAEPRGTPIVNFFQD